MDATQTLVDYEHTATRYVDLPQRRADDAARIEAEPIDHVPARAIVIAVVMGVGLWALIIGAGWLIFR